MSLDVREGVGGLLWYAECKQLAIEQVMSFRPPADREKMRMYHSLYLTSLLSLIELSVEMFGNQVEDAWREALEGAGGQTGENNLCYVRELRNAAVHRGADITAAGTVILGQTCAVSPGQAFHRLGKKGPFTAFAPLLRDVFAICEEAVGPVVLDAAESTLASLEQSDPGELASQALKAVESSVHIPEWARRMAIEQMHVVPFEELRGFQPRKLRDLLSLGAPHGLAISIRQS